MRKRRLSLIGGIILLVLALGMGYAFLTTNLNIEGIADIDSNTWDVYWDNVQVTTGSVEAEEPEIDTDKTTVTFSVHLSKPGDFYEFTVDAVNDGSIDAMIDTITRTINGGTTVPNYLRYTVTYSDDIEITPKQILKADTFETYKVRVEYRSDIDEGDLPSNPESNNIVFGIDYVQKDDTSKPVRRIIYIANEGDQCIIGDPIPEGLTIYDSYQDAIDASGYNYWVKIIAVNDIITDAYVGFILNDEVYYVRGAGGYDGNNLKITPYYESNREIVLNAFGSNGCFEETDASGKKTLDCWYDNLSVIVIDRGSISVAVSPYGGYTCYVNSTNETGCYFSY